MKEKSTSLILPLWVLFFLAAFQHTLVLKAQEYQRLDLSNLEKTDHNEKLFLMQKASKLYPQYTEQDNWMKKYINYFHFIDLDQDGDLDLVFDGWSGAEPMMVEISFQINWEFKRQFKGFVDLVELKMKNGVLDELTLYDPGCCSAVIAHEVQYKFDVEKDVVNYWVTEHLEFYNPTIEPKDFFDSPVPFEVIKDKSSLRSSPEEDKEGQLFQGRSGNIYKSIPTGRKGYAYSELEDALGNVWWYVYIDPQSRTNKKVQFQEDFYPRDKGWINSKDVKPE